MLYGAAGMMHLLDNQYFQRDLCMVTGLTYWHRKQQLTARSVHGELPKTKQSDVTCAGFIEFGPISFVVNG